MPSGQAFTAPVAVASVAVALLALGSSGVTAATAGEGSRGPWTFRHAYFTLRLPAGWQLADFEPEKQGFVPVPAKPGAKRSGEVSFADRRGNYFAVFVDPATEDETDAIWDVAVGADGSSVRVVHEGGMCRRPADPAYDGPCTAGDGTLEIVTFPALEIRGHTYGFNFGNTERETGVDLAPFWAILRSFRAW